jgi:hypothetical protein
VPQLFAKMASALHHVLDEATEAQVVEIPDDVVAAAEQPKSLFGKYVLLARIGRGGSGVVHRAWQRDCNRMVALKQLASPEAATPDQQKTPYGLAESVKRFFTEARAIAELDHPNIVPLYDYGVAEQTFYYTMPLIEGGSLDALLRGPANADEALPARHLVGESEVDAEQDARVHHFLGGVGEPEILPPRSPPLLDRGADGDADCSETHRQCINK